MALSSFSLNSYVLLNFSFLLCCLSYLIHHSSGILHQLCRDDDSLLQFKQSFVIDKYSCGYSKLNSWKVGDDCCLWDGVVCDNETGHVIGLHLSGSCLYGSIDSTSPLFRLVHLRNLSLSSNDFNLSRIPDAIKSLSQLERLNLSFSSFQGDIPSQILELSKLVSLDLSGNSDLMLQKPSLKDVVQTLTNLSELQLVGVNIASSVPQSLSNLTSLTTLVLGDCSLLGEFPVAIFRLPYLRVLGLWYNPNLTGYLPEFDVGSPLEKLSLVGTNFSGHLPISIGNLKSLSFFNAGECRFFGAIPTSIGNLTKLHVLGLSTNYLSGKIPTSLGNLYQLTKLSLSLNNFSSSTLDWLGKLTNLNYLDLKETNSYGTIPYSFQNLTELAELYLGSNQLTGHIPPWLCNCTKITMFKASKNELQGPIPESLFRLPNLQILYLYSNNLSGSLTYDSFLQSKLFGFEVSRNHLSIMSSPYTNTTLPKFQVLGLGECNLTEIPSFLHGQNEIEFLSLDGNKIEGYVPGWLFTLKSLHFLFLDNNNLEGFEQPLSVLQQTNLRTLDLSSNEFQGFVPIPPPSIIIYDVSQNRFSGEISPLFCNLSSALSLDFSDNNLSGNLPPCLGKLGDSALVVDVENNSLSGKIPDLFTSDCTLKVIDFSQNKFEGKLPRSLSNCSNLEILNVEENHMNDVFPSWLGTLPHLRVLSLKSNKFDGAIGKPLSKFEFGQLQIIDLSDNYFTGKLPKEYLQNWVAMKVVNNHHLAYMKAKTNFEMSLYTLNIDYKYSIKIVNKGTERAYKQILEFLVVIDLSSNRFEGEIPDSIGTLRELQSLNLSNNILTGHIPSSLGNLTKLEALDISQNNLSGHMPTQLAFLTFLAFFNASHNSLTGPIPHGSQFDTFDNTSFSGNPGLCGDQLLVKCGNTNPLSPVPSEDEDEDSPFKFGWEIVLIGFSTGLVIGGAFGWAMDTRKYEWLVKKKFGRRI